MMTLWWLLLFVGYVAVVESWEWSSVSDDEVSVGENSINCTGTRCTLECDENFDCSNKRIDCPSGSDCESCEINCLERSSCANSTIYSHSCKDVTINCNEKSDVNDSDSDTVAALEDTTIHAPDNYGDITLNSMHGQCFVSSKLLSSPSGTGHMTLNCDDTDNYSECKQMEIDATYAKTLEFHCRDGATCNRNTITCPDNDNAVDGLWHTPCLIDCSSTNNRWNACRDVVVKARQGLNNDVTMRCDSSNTNSCRYSRIECGSDYSKSCDWWYTGGPYPIGWNCLGDCSSLTTAPNSAPTAVTSPPSLGSTTHESDDNDDNDDNDENDESDEQDYENVDDLELEPNPNKTGVAEWLKSTEEIEILDGVKSSVDTKDANPWEAILAFLLDSEHLYVFLMLVLILSCCCVFLCCWVYFRRVENGYKTSFKDLEMYLARHGKLRSPMSSATGSKFTNAQSARSKASRLSSNSNSSSNHSSHSKTGSAVLAAWIREGRYCGKCGAAQNLDKMDKESDDSDLPLKCEECGEMLEIPENDGKSSDHLKHTNSSLKTTDVPPAPPLIIANNGVHAKSKKHSDHAASSHTVPLKWSQGAQKQPKQPKQPQQPEMVSDEDTLFPMNGAKMARLEEKYLGSNQGRGRMRKNNEKRKKRKTTRGRKGFGNTLHLPGRHRNGFVPPPPPPLSPLPKSQQHYFEQQRQLQQQHIMKNHSNYVPQPPNMLMQQQQQQQMMQRPSQAWREEAFRLLIRNVFGRLSSSRMFSVSDQQPQQQQQLQQQQQQQQVHVAQATQGTVVEHDGLINEIIVDPAGGDAYDAAYRKGYDTDGAMGESESCDVPSLRNDSNYNSNSRTSRQQGHQIQFRRGGNMPQNGSNMDNSVNQGNDGYFGGIMKSFQSISNKIWLGQGSQAGGDKDESNDYYANSQNRQSRASRFSRFSRTRRAREESAHTASSVSQENDVLKQSYEAQLNKQGRHPKLARKSTRFEAVKRFFHTSLQYDASVSGAGSVPSHTASNTATTTSTTVSNTSSSGTDAALLPDLPQEPPDEIEIDYDSDYNYGSNVNTNFNNANYMNSLNSLTSNMFDLRALGMASVPDGTEGSFRAPGAFLRMETSDMNLNESDDVVAAVVQSVDVDDIARAFDKPRTMSTAIDDLVSRNSHGSNATAADSECKMETTDDNPGGEPGGELNDLEGAGAGHHQEPSGNSLDESEMNQILRILQIANSSDAGSEDNRSAGQQTFATTSAAKMGDPALAPGVATTVASVTDVCGVDASTDVTDDDDDGVRSITNVSKSDNLNVGLARSVRFANMNEETVGGSSASNTSNTSNTSSSSSASGASSASSSSSSSSALTVSGMDEEQNKHRERNYIISVTELKCTGYGRYSYSATTATSAATGGTGILNRGGAAGAVRPVDVVSEVSEVTDCGTMATVVMKGGNENELFEAKLDAYMSGNKGYASGNENENGVAPVESGLQKALKAKAAAEALRQEEMEAEHKANGVNGANSGDDDPSSKFDDDAHLWEDFAELPQGRQRANAHQRGLTGMTEKLERIEQEEKKNEEAREKEQLVTKTLKDDMTVVSDSEFANAQHDITRSEMIKLVDVALIKDEIENATVAAQSRHGSLMSDMDQVAWRNRPDANAQFQSMASIVTVQDKKYNYNVGSNFNLSMKKSGLLEQKYGVKKGNMSMVSGISGINSVSDVSEISDWYVDESIKSAETEDSSTLRDSI